jgi:hypothetical protein
MVCLPWYSVSQQLTLLPTYFSEYWHKLLKELSKIRSLHFKLDEWSHIAFGRRPNKEDPRWEKFIDLRNLRNEFIHFKSSHETIVPQPGVYIHGAVNLKAFDRLGPSTPDEVIEVIVGVVEVVGELRGVSPRSIPGFLHQWLGYMRS